MFITLLFGTGAELDGGYDAAVFAMLRGPWPRVLSSGIDVTALEAEVADGSKRPEVLAVALVGLVDEALTAQLDAGCELLTDGHVRWPDPVAALLEAASMGDAGPSGMLARAFLDTANRVPSDAASVAQAIPGPFTLALRESGESIDLEAVTGRALAFAELLAGELDALRDAGCAAVVVEEPAAAAVRSESAGNAWVQAHRRMLGDVRDLHVMLSIAGGDATSLGGRAIGGLPYASVLLDLVTGPENWHVVRDLPGARGVVCAALTAAPGKPLGDQSAQLVWAARYAASMGGRGLARVGLSNASSLETLTPVEARAALDAVAQAARYAVMGRTEAVAAGFDERAWRVMPKAGPGRRP